jgi:hypothetical protein
MTPPSYPARPVNGGPLPHAQPKHGDWAWEPKFNGWRALVHGPTGTMFNRHLQPLSIAGEFTAALDLLKGTRLEWLDCEALERRHHLGQGTLILLDYLPVLPHGCPPYLQRRGLLELACGFGHIAKYQDLHRPPPTHTVLLTPSYRDPDGTGLPEFLRGQLAALPTPHAGPGTLDFGLWTILQNCNRTLGCLKRANHFYEGLVAKRCDSPYPLQRRSDAQDFPFWMKHRWAF